MLTLAQTSITSSEGLIQLYQTLGGLTFFGLIFAYFAHKIIAMEGKIKEGRVDREKIEAEIEAKAQATQDKLIEQQIESNKKLEARLDSREKAFDAERSAWKTERKTLADDRTHLKTELERSLKKEADLSTKIKDLTGDVEVLRKRINDLEAERKTDQLEKEQILKESEIVAKQLEQERKDRHKIEKERDLTQKMLADYSKTIEGLEKRITALEDSTKQKDHELSKAYGTIASLTEQLAKVTDDTQKLPQLGEDGTPIQVEIVDPPNTVTPADSSADNTLTDDNKKDVA